MSQVEGKGIGSMEEPETVWERLMHHEIRIVFARGRRSGRCVARRVRYQPRRVGSECTQRDEHYLAEALYYAGQDSGDFWPHDIWPVDVWPSGHSADDL